MGDSAQELPPSRRRDRHVGVFFFVAVALLLSAWSLVVPIFEAPDEPAHWTYARFLHDFRRLPDTTVVAQANYPPLYYLLIAPLAAPTVLPERAGNDRVAMAYPPRLYLNRRDDLGRYWPIRLARLASVAIALCGLWCCFLAGVIATGRWTTGLLTAGIVAGLPQFAFRSGTVADDVLVTALAALATALFIALLRRGFTWRRGIGAAIAVAAAALAKISALYLFLPLVVVLLLAPGARWRARPSRLLVLVAAALFLLPWMGRNVALYGDPLAAGTVTGAIADRVVRHDLLSRYMLVELPLHAIKSLIGNFGWQTLGLPWWLYGLYLGLMACGAVGFARRWLRVPEGRPLLAILVLIPLLNWGVLISLNLNYVAWQGRYLFPALPALGLALALGLEALPGWRPHYAPPLVALLTMMCALILGFVVAPAYWPAP